MYIEQATITKVVIEIWEALFGWDIRPASPDDLPQSNRGLYTGFIQIAGTWEGAVVCIGSDELVRQIAAAMFRTVPKDLSVESLLDALGELTNMVGGNLKALLPGPSYLCLPTVVEGADYSVCVPTAKLVTEVGFLSTDQPFMVKLLAGGASSRLHRASMKISQVN